MGDGTRSRRDGGSGPGPPGGPPGAQRIRGQRVRPAGGPPLWSPGRYGHLPHDRPQPRRGTPRGHPAGAVLRPLLRRRDRAGRRPAGARARGGPSRHRGDRLLLRLLRRVVGLDELHLVRLRLRLRRCAVPDRHPGADRRRTRLRGGGEPGLRRERLDRRRHRLHHHARRADGAVAARRRRGAGPGQGCGSEVRGWSGDLSGRLGGAAVRPGRRQALAVPGPGRRRADGAGDRRARARDALAPPPHRGAVRPVHHHRAGRDDRREHGRGQVGDRRARGPRRAAAPRGGRAADRVRRVVDLLRRPHARTPDVQP